MSRYNLRKSKSIGIFSAKFTAKRATRKYMKSLSLPHIILKDLPTIVLLPLTVIPFIKNNQFNRFYRFAYQFWFIIKHNFK